jgi:hypothetical protein
MVKGKCIPGVVLWEGESPLADGRCVVVATFKTDNTKTGNMVQVWILRTDVDPASAVSDGSDDAVCGDCPLRAGVCYVATQNAPLQVWKSWRRGLYPKARPAHLELFRGRKVRWGAYGDPVCIPTAIIETVNAVSDGWTGYTHQWRDPRFAEFRRWLHASTETPAAAAQARAAGWLTFRVRCPDEPLLPGEFQCPASREKGMVRECATCMACNGTGGRPSSGAVSPSIVLHGGNAATPTAFRRRISLATVGA